MPNHLAEKYVRVGMLAVIRDIQEWAADEDVLDGRLLRAYMLACLITAGAYDDGDGDPSDGQG